MRSPVCAYAGEESTTAPASAANSRRVMVMFISASLGGAGLDQRRAMFLRPS
jgi:hypothetical protein